MGRNGYTAYTDATVQRYNRDLSVAQGQLNKLYDDYRELESLYNSLDEDIMQWDTEQDHVEQATDQQGVWKGERRNKYDEYLWDTMVGSEREKPYDDAQDASHLPLPGV